jgi:small subunit ribosomal protein S8
MENSVIDLIIRIKNGYLVKKESIGSPFSNFKHEVLKKLKECQFIEDFEVTGQVKKSFLIKLRYLGGEPAMTDVKIFSKPGQRSYVSYRKIKPVLNNFGFSFISTPKGILTDREAKKTKTGGELLFAIW